jgi:hypothetical protein
MGRYPHIGRHVSVEKISSARTKNWAAIANIRLGREANGGHSKWMMAMPILDWLEVYLTRCHGHPAVTGGALIPTAEAAAERGIPLVLDGISS